MRIQCTFNLAPELHEQHDFAIENLRAWQISEKARNDDKDIAQQRRSIFHRDIYLSGLYLHQLSPDLPKRVSEQYKPSGVSAKGLTQQVALFDDELLTSANMPIEQASGIVLDDSQWLKFEGLLAEQQQQFTQQQQQLEQSRHQAQLDINRKNQIESERHSAQLIAQLTELVSGSMSDKLIELQAQNLQILADLKDNAATQSVLESALESSVQIQEQTQEQPQEQSDLRATARQAESVITALDEQKLQLLGAIDANQQSLLSAFNRLQKQMTDLGQNVNQNLASGQSVMSASEQQEVQVLNTQLQRASKIKAKGLW